MGQTAPEFKSPRIAFGPEVGADLPEVMLTEEVATFLRMSPESLTNMYYKRKKWLPPRRKLGGVYRYLKRDVIACVMPAEQ
jgi:hypothetical protein